MFWDGTCSGEIAVWNVFVRSQNIQSSVLDGYVREINTVDWTCWILTHLFWYVLLADRVDLVDFLSSLSSSEHAWCFHHLVNIRNGDWIVFNSCLFLKEETPHRIFFNILQLVTCDVLKGDPDGANNWDLAKVQSSENHCGRHTRPSFHGWTSTSPGRPTSLR